MEKMSVHRGLAELKLLKSRIEKAISNLTVVSIKVGEADKINGTSIIDIEKDMKSKLSSLEDLITRRSDIKSAIIQSNANTLVKISDARMSVAEAIDRKQSIEFEEELLKKMVSQYSRTVSLVEREEAELNEKANNFVISVYGEKGNVSAASVQSIRDGFIKQHCLSLIDPIGVSDKIESLTKKVEDFILEIDFVLSESNALTFIEV